MTAEAIPCASCVQTHWWTYSSGACDPKDTFFETLVVEATWESQYGLFQVC